MINLSCPDSPLIETKKQITKIDQKSQNHSVQSQTFHQISNIQQFYRTRNRSLSNYRPNSPTHMSLFILRANKRANPLQIDIRRFRPNCQKNVSGSNESENFKSVLRTCNRRLIDKQTSHCCCGKTGHKAIQIKRDKKNVQPYIEQIQQTARLAGQNDQIEAWGPTLNRLFFAKNLNDTKNPCSTLVAGTRSQQFEFFAKKSRRVFNKK